MLSTTVIVRCFSALQGCSISTVYGWRSIQC